MPIFVLAGSAVEAKEWARGQRLRRREWRYIARPRDLEGVSGVRIARVGTYASRRDAAEFSDLVFDLERCGCVRLI